MDCIVNAGDQLVSFTTYFPDVENDDWTEITKWLKRDVLSKGIHFMFSGPTVDRLIGIINRTISTFMWYDCLEESVAETLTETLKALRLQVTSEQVVKYLIGKSVFYEVFNQLISYLLTKRNGPKLYTKYLLQFFLNLVSAGNDEQKKHARQKIREGFCIQNFYLYFANVYGHFYEMSAILYNLYCDIELENASIISCILQHHTNQDKTNEYLDFLIVKIIVADFVWQQYLLIEPAGRLELLNCLREIFICPNSTDLIVKVRQLPEVCLICLVNRLNACSNVIFQVVQQGDPVAVEEVSRILEILAHLSSDEKYLPYLQSDTALLINSGVLLVNAHRLGKSANSVFSPLQKLSEIQSPGEDVRRNPVFGFKADLVRLIGNLCWKNRRMQDLAREGELIEVLLDTCNIDAKNPFIIQWVILAIHNICEGNNDNQAIIAGLTQKGVVSSEVLEEFGLTLHTENDLTIGMIGLDLNKKV